LKGANGLDDMKPIDPPDKHHLLAAQGWLELGNDLEAFSELEKISPELSVHPEVLKVRRQIYVKNKNWITALQIARTIVQSEPNHLFSRIYEAYDPYASRRSPAEVDGPAAEGVRLPLFFAVPYNLACYACQLGNLEEAWEWFQMALEMSDAHEIRKLALKDPDLEPLWQKIGQV
jgi:tetratricopeptide (TPR) repeat protein